MRLFERVRGGRVEIARIQPDGDRVLVSTGRLEGEVTTEVRLGDATLMADEFLATGFKELTAKQTPGTRGTLEAAMIADPDEIAVHAAYADFLTEEGDPRGEFIHVQLALENEQLDAADRKKLQKRELALLRDLEPKWLGELRRHMGPSWGHKAESLRPRFGWHRGWIDFLEVPDAELSVMRQIARHPMFRMLRKLWLPNDAGSVATLELPNLRKLVLGREGSSIFVGNPVPLVASCPLLETLHLFGTSNDMSSLWGLRTNPRLRDLQWDHGGEVFDLEALASNPAFANLERLAFYPLNHNNMSRGDFLPLRAVGALLRSPNFPRLTHLRLCMSSAGDEGVALLVEHGWLKRLKVLDLSYGRITDDGAKMLLECPDARNLEMIDLGGNMLSVVAFRELGEAGIPVVDRPVPPESEIE